MHGSTFPQIQGGCVAHACAAGLDLHIPRLGELSELAAQGRACSTCRLCPRQEQDSVGRSACPASPALEPGSEGGWVPGLLSVQECYSMASSLLSAMQSKQAPGSISPRSAAVLPPLLHPMTNCDSPAVGTLRMVSFMSSVSAPCAAAERSTWEACQRCIHWIRFMRESRTKSQERVIPAPTACLLPTAAVPPDPPTHPLTHTP